MKECCAKEVEKVNRHWQVVYNRDTVRLGSDIAECREVLDLIVAEWDSDPSSTACFDRRIIERAKKCLLR